jgi:putative membrane protein insertion efficiency factor
MNTSSRFLAFYRRVHTWLRSAQVPGLAYTTCKFHPSCSEYAELAIERHGILKGAGMAIIRIIRCNPFSSGGVDYP